MSLVKHGGGVTDAVPVEFRGEAMRSRQGKQIAQQASVDNLAVEDLETGGRNEFLFVPEIPARAQMAADAGFCKIKKLRLSGTVRDTGNGDWQLHGTLQASVVQQCVVTLNPVTSPVQAKLTRLYVTDASRLMPKSDFEIPEDENLELLRERIDLFELARETLLLELPQYPRIADAGSDGFATGEVPKAAEAPQPNPFAALKKKFQI